MGNEAPVALLADDMGLGKTFTALGAFIHIKWISSEAVLGQRLPCLGDRTISELEGEVPPFFSSAIEDFHHPAMVIVPASLIKQWETAISGLLEGTSCTLVNINAHRSLTSANLNYESEFPECGRAIYIISYPTYRNRCAESLAGFA